MSDCQTHHEMSDNRYTLRLKPYQKEWVTNTPDASELIRGFIDSRINMNTKTLDIFTIRQLMTKNLKQIEVLDHDVLFIRCKRVLKTFEEQKRFPSKNGKITLIDFEKNAIEKTKRIEIAMNHYETLKVIEPPDIEFESNSEALLNYLNRCRNIVDSFNEQISQLYAENKKLEAILCQTFPIVSDSLTQVEVYSETTSKTSVSSQDSAKGEGQ